MAKVGRNDPCPCGSGKKVKRCCIEKVGAERLLDVLRASRDQMVAKNERLETERDELVKQLAALEADREADAVAGQVRALLGSGQLERAEAVGRQLEEMFAGETEGIERLAEVYESREMRAEAAAQYRRAIAMMDEWGRGHYCDCCRARMVKAVRRLDPDGPSLELGFDPQ
jgi:hypothetical protein